MKHGPLILWVIAIVTGFAVLVAPVLQAQQRRLCQGRQVQPPEGQALLSQEWARVHARPVP